LHYRGKGVGYESYKTKQMIRKKGEGKTNDGGEEKGGKERN